jgi:hypothetical protein
MPLESIMEDLEFKEAHSEIKLKFRNYSIERTLRGPLTNSDVVALIISVQPVPLREFTSAMRAFAEAAIHAKRAAITARKAHAALISIPDEIRRRDVTEQELGVNIQGIAASAERWNRLAVHLGRYSDLFTKNHWGHPLNKQFNAFVKILAYQYELRSGEWPTVSKSTGIYGGEFVNLAEAYPRRARLGVAPNHQCGRRARTRGAAPLNAFSRALRTADPRTDGGPPILSPLFTTSFHF